MSFHQITSECGKIECITRNCSSCGTTKLHVSVLEANPGLEENQNIIQWTRWISVQKYPGPKIKKLILKTYSGTRKELLDIFLTIDTYCCNLKQEHLKEIIKNCSNFYHFRREATKEDSSTESSDVHKKSVLLQVMSPTRKGKKKKMKQSQIEIHHDKKLVIKLPQQQSQSSSGLNNSGPKRTSSPIVLDDSDTSTKSGRTRSATKRKSTDNSVPIKHKEKKEKVKKKLRKRRKKKEKQQIRKEEKPKKNGANKGTSNGSANGSVREKEKGKKGLGDFTGDEFLKEDGLHKWRYVIDMAANDDCKAIDILITERRDAISAEMEKDMKKAQKKEDVKIKGEKDSDPIVITEDKQTDGSYDHTSGSEEAKTDATDLTDETTVNPKSVGEN